MNGTDIDDLAVFLLDHNFSRLAGAEIHGAQIEIDDGSPLLIGLASGGRGTPCSGIVTNASNSQAQGIEAVSFCPFWGVGQKIQGTAGST
jgi:hypothetical protein